MSTASSASFTASESLSALLCTCTVASPSSRAARMMRTAISPRLAIRSFLIVIGGLRKLDFDFDNRLAGHDSVLVLRKEAHDLAGHARLHLIEGFHDLHEPDRVALRDRVAVGFVGRLVGCRLAIEDAGEG